MRGVIESRGRGTTWDKGSGKDSPKWHFARIQSRRRSQTFHEPAFALDKQQVKTLRGRENLKVSGLRTEATLTEIEIGGGVATDEMYSWETDWIDLQKIWTLLSLSSHCLCALFLYWQLSNEHILAIRKVLYVFLKNWIRFPFVEYNQHFCTPGKNFRLFWRK